MRLALLAVVAAGCSNSSMPRTDGPVEVLPPGACRFAHLGNPSGYQPGTDVINAQLERLEAPPGGLWWIRESLQQDTVAATGPAGPIRLAVQHPGTVAGSSFSTLRVPDLPPGTRLMLGGRMLVVGQPLARPNIEGLVLRHAYRPELGGTGFTIDLPTTMRRQVMVLEAWVGPSHANVQLGIHVLHHLLLSDLPAICNPRDAEGDPVFVPLWMGETGQALGVTLVDADNLANERFRRLCPTPDLPSACLPCHGC